MKRRLKKSHYNNRVSLHEAPTKNGVFGLSLKFNWFEIAFFGFSVKCKIYLVLNANTPISYNYKLVMIGL